MLKIDKKTTTTQLSFHVGYQQWGK